MVLENFCNSTCLLFAISAGKKQQKLTVGKKPKFQKKFNYEVVITFV